MSKPLHTKTLGCQRKSLLSTPFFLCKFTEKNTWTLTPPPDQVIVLYRTDCGSTRNEYSHQCVVSWASFSPALSLPFSAPCKPVTQHVRNVRRGPDVVPVPVPVPVYTTEICCNPQQRDQTQPYAPTVVAPLLFFLQVRGGAGPRGTRARGYVPSQDGGWRSRTETKRKPQRAQPRGTESSQNPFFRNDCFLLASAIKDMSVHETPRF